MRPTTMPKQWKELLDAAAEKARKEGKPMGGLEYICYSCGVAQSTIYRASRGQITLGAEIQDRLQVLCDLLDVDNPYEKTKPWSKDLIPLSMLGKEIAMGLPISPKAVKRLQKLYPEAQLLKLAESDGTPENIMHAVQKVLEDT
jgi:hypothetical protein